MLRGLLILLLAGSEASQFPLFDEAVALHQQRTSPSFDAALELYQRFVSGAAENASSSASPSAAADDAISLQHHPVSYTHLTLPTICSV